MIQIDRNLQGLKSYLALELDGIYQKEEIKSITNLLLENLLQIDLVAIHSNPNHSVSDEQIGLFIEYVRQLKQNKPIQYILGEAEFYGLKFKLGPSVLIPRPETEELVEWVISKTDKNKKINIIDIGTGSGCIGISLAKNLENANVCISDVSDKALLVALKNAELNNVNSQFYLFDILDCDHVEMPDQFDIIVSNPPYVRESEKLKMNKNVLDYEPSLALFVKDEDPLIFYRKIIEFAKKNLKRSGELFFEINENLSQETSDLLKFEGFSNIELKKDINGRDRMIYAKR